MKPEPKPPRTACQHCTRGGCAIYEDRPEPCREWSCVWLVSQTRTDIRLPSAMRPDRSGVVLELNSAGNIVAHCATPAAWKREPVNSWLRRMAKKNRVLIETGPEEVLFFEASGATRAMQFVGLNKETNERLYKLEGVL